LKTYNFTSVEKLLTKEDKTVLEWLMAIPIYIIGTIWIAILVLPFMLLIIMLALPLGILDWFKRKGNNANINN